MRRALVLFTLMALGAAACSNPQPPPLTPEALQQAPELNIDNLGPVQKVASVKGYFFSRGTEAYPPRLGLGCAGPDGSWIVNLTDGTSRKVTESGFERQYIGWPSGVGADGKVFVAASGGGLIVFDPTADTIKMLFPTPRARWLHGLAVGPDGGVYVTDYPTGTAARYDPVTEKIDSYGRQGGPFKNKRIYGYDIGCDGEWVYTTAGKMPWYVVAYNRQTRKQTNLLTYPKTDHLRIVQRGEKVFLIVEYGRTSADKGKPTKYRLADGKATPIDTVPDEDPTLIPGHDRPQPRIQPIRRNLPMVEGGALLRYKPAGSEQWTETVIPMSGLAMNVEHLSPTQDGKLMIAVGPYGDVFRFDPAGKAITRLGSPAHKHAYDLLDVDGKIYFCGYPNSMFGVFDGDGDGKELGNWHDTVISKHAFYLVRGADGRIYSGNHAERERVGGALGWYDPKTNKFGGIVLPNDDCESLTTALNGKLIVYASDISADPTNPEATPPAGSLFVYDTDAQKIARKFSPVQGPSAGKIVEIAPGVVLGFSHHEGKPVVYTADVVAGEVLKRMELPTKAIRNVAVGPDGKAYAFLGGTLVRVSGETLKVEPLGTTKPGAMAFVGRDLYLCGTTELRRIVDIAR